MGALSIRDRLAAKRGTIAASRAKGLKPYKWSSGKTNFRIIPNIDPNADWDRRFGKTYLKSFDEKNFFAIGDRDITYGETDPIREMIFDAMRQAPDEETKEHYYKMLAKPRVIFNALILNDKDKSPLEPVIVEVSESAFDTILAQFEVYSDMDPDYDLASAKMGHIFTCEKTGTGLDTKYNFLATPQKAPLKTEIIEKAHDLDAWIQSQFEGLEQKAIEFLGKLNGSIGISTTVPAALLTASPAATAAASRQAPNNISTAAVTHVVDDAEFDEVEEGAEPEAESPFETVEDEDSPFEVEVEDADAAKKAAAAQVAATKKAAAKAVETTVAPSADDEDIENILASLA